jgi:hypothetical protein
MDADNVLESTPPMQAARQAVAEAFKVPTMVRLYYRQAVKQLPMLLHQHGLAQTLAYLQMRGEGKPASPYSVLLKQIDRWLLVSMGVSARSALGAISGNDSRFYMEASEHARLFVRALRMVVEETQ